MIHKREQDEPVPSAFGRLTRAPLLTPEAEKQLATAAQAGDARARERLVESNMRLVINIAKGFRQTSIPLEDLIQDGAIGLMMAIDRFRPELGYRFSTYSTHWIRQSIGRAVDNKSRAIRIPAHISQTIRKIEKAKAKAAKELGREPSTEQIAAELGISSKRLQILFQASRELLSLDTVIGDGDNTSLGNLIKDEACTNPELAAIDAEALEELHAVFKELTKKEQRVMEQRLKATGPAEYKECNDGLSEELQISRERIRQIELQAIKKLRLIADERHLHRRFI